MRILSVGCSMYKGIVLTLFMLCTFQVLQAQTAELDSLIKEQVQLYISNYPQDDYSIRAKRIMNVLKSHDDKVNMLDDGDFERKSKELESIKYAMIFINEQVHKGTSIEKAKAIYQRQTQRKVQTNTNETQVEQPAFTVPENTKD